MSHVVTLDPEIVFQSNLAPSNVEHAIDALYTSYYKGVRNFEGDMRALHDHYLTLISPASAELCRRASSGRILICEDFLQSIHARSAHMADEATRIRISFERQHRAALELAKMI